MSLKYPWNIVGLFQGYFKDRPTISQGYFNPGFYLEFIGFLSEVYFLLLYIPATTIAEPEFALERNVFGVNEGPQALISLDNKTFLVYSAIYCGTDDYTLGLLALKVGGNPMVKEDWTKSTQPIFTQQPQNNAFGPGHNSFFKSPDGKESWIIYHANSSSNQGCADRRSIRMQKFSFKADGSPDFAVPVATGLQVASPSGES